MEDNNQAPSTTAMPQNELQAIQSGMTTPLRRSIRLRNKAALKLKSLHKLTNRSTASCVQSSDHYKIKYQRRKRKTTFSMLPDDMLINIMSRLPPKPFFRCKRVSKSLRTLSTEAFRLNKCFRPTVCGLYHDILTCQRNQRFRYAEVSDLASQEDDRDPGGFPYRDNVKIVDCCGGLLLLQAWNFPVQNNCLYVYNPATYNTLAAWSLPSQKSSWTFYESFSLAFDLKVPSQFYIVCFRGWTNGDTDLNFFQTFFSKTGKWRSQKSLGSNCRIGRWHSGTFVDGKVCRLVSMNRVLCIDPSKNSFQLIPLPEIENSFRPQLAQSQGYLHFIADVNHTLKIWILDDQKQWVQKHQLTFNQVFGVSLYEHLNHHFFIASFIFRNPVALHPEEDILYVPSASGKLMSFDLRTQRRRELCNLPRNSLLVFWVYIPCYLT